MIFGAPPLSYSIPQELRGQLFIGSFILSVLSGVVARGRGRLHRGPLVPAAADRVRTLG
jgi:hypothetical protein